MINDGFYFEGAEAEQRFQEHQDTVNEYAWNADTAELKLFPFRYTIPILACIEWLCCAALFLFLLCAAGHRAGR